MGDSVNIIIKCIVVCVCSIVLYQIISAYRQADKKQLSIKDKCALIFTGFIANIADTLGLGSFAVVIALNNKLKMVDDKQIPGTLNAQSVLPTMLQSLLFLNFVEMDISILILFVLSACVGGFLSGYFVSRLDKATIRKLMCYGFIAVALLIFSQKMDLLPVGGFATSLPPHKMAIGAVAMVFAGMLPAIGGGMYVPIQAILFLLGLSPLVAFPIMTTTGAIVQTTTASAFVMRREFAVKESLYLAISGFLGVAIAVPMITYVNLSTLRWMLLAIVIYNAISLWKTIRQETVNLIRI